jgi:hypothetical protein
MKLDQLVKLGEEMGRTLTAKPYEAAKQIWDSLHYEEDKETAKTAFYGAAELSYQLTVANKDQKVPNVSKGK